MKVNYPLAILLSALVSTSSVADSLRIQADEDLIVIERGETPVLTYHAAIMAPPEGADPLFRRSGFIHPLNAPNGDVVTSIHAPDHIHHMGLWHAWVKTKWNDRSVDFWNIKGGDGTVRYAETTDVRHDDDTVGFTVRQEHVALAEDGYPEVVVLDERLRVSVTATDEVNVVDYEMTQTNVTDFALELIAHRYGGGIAFRSALGWGESDDSYRISTGLGRADSHATRSRWAAMQGPTEHGESTVVIMGDPANYGAPQRMRIWPEGEVFFNYVPAQEADWRIEPGETITLRYRVLVYAGKVSVEQIEEQWEKYRSR